MFRSRFVAFGLVAATAVAVVGDPAHAAAGALAPHRAVYDIELKEASERSGIEGIRGRMVYEFNGSECAGYTTNFRFVTRIDSGEQVRVTDQQSLTHEDLVAHTFRFETKSFTDDQLDKDVSGEAEGDNGKVTVELSEPERRQVELDASRFPSSHMLDVLENARKGTRIFEARIFDGSENGDESYLTTTILGQPQTPQAGDPDADKVGPLAVQAFWPVSIAYFEDGDSGDTMPIYTQTFKLYENGVTRDLTLDYGDFVLTGRLAKLEMLGSGECNGAANRAKP